MAIVRRISLLQYFYTGRRLDAPFTDLKAAAGRVRLLDHDLRLESSSRYAARHRKRLNTSGLRGHLDLDLAAAGPLWPYLHLGQWLNIGKGASMGFGRYRVSV